MAPWVLTIRPILHGQGDPEGTCLLDELSAELVAALRPFGPGSWAWALSRIRDPNAHDDVRLEALHRVATELFSRGRVCHPNRWVELDEAFRAYRQSFLTFDEAWVQLVANPLQEAVRDDGVLRPTGTEWYDETRRQIRPHVERELIGRTLDSHDPAERLEPPEPEDVRAVAEVRADLTMALLQIPVEQREAVMAPLSDVSDAVLAARDGVSEATIRKRRQRGRSHLGELLE